MRQVAAARSRRLSTAVLVVLLAAFALAMHAAVPGITQRFAPFAAHGTGAATSGPLTLQVHQVRLANAIEVDDEELGTTGVFVVADVTIASDVPADEIAAELSVGGRVYEPSEKSFRLFDASLPAPGIPVRGDIVFEVDGDLVGAVGEIRIATEVTASSDLEPQPNVAVRLDGPVVDALVVTEVHR